jgi:glyoxylase-like metal-dependent hydrolase (beta-lactamase superfamily II)
MGVNVETLVVGMFQENCFLCHDTETGAAIIVDPGDEADRIAELIASCGCTPKAVLLTHGHVDHIGAVNELRSRYDIPLTIGKGEEVMLADSRINGSEAWGQPIVVQPADRIVKGEDLVSYSGLSFRVLSTPGHSPGGVCYFLETNGLLFCGDTLFAGSIGRTDLYGGSLHTLIDSIAGKILRLPDSVVCYPGHGPTTTVGAERNGNPFLTGNMFA